MIFTNKSFVILNYHDWTHWVQIIMILSILKTIFEQKITGVPKEKKFTQVKNLIFQKTIFEAKEMVLFSLLLGLLNKFRNICTVLIIKMVSKYQKLRELYNFLDL